MDSPLAAPFLSAEWRHLAMASYRVEPELLQPLVPAGTELDLWSGQCLVSVVGFQFLETRVLGVGVPFHRSFQEVNLRFYVRRVVGRETRRGVVFVKEIVPRRAIAWLANALYDEKYITLPMSYEDRLDAEPRSLAYRWQLGEGSYELSVRLEGASYLPDETSEEAFVTEHYFGYTAARDGSTFEYRVEHPRWRVWRAHSFELSGDMAALYGPEVAPFLQNPPSSVFVADGSEVLVRKAVRLA